jgi:hypothetical protein
MKNFLILIFFLACLIGCQKLKMDIPDTGRKIAINGMISTDELLNLRVTKSSYITDPENKEDWSVLNLDSAEVFIYNQECCIDTLKNISRWVSDYMDRCDDLFPLPNYMSRTVTPVPGNMYKVVVRCPGLPEASVECIMPHTVKIEKLDSTRLTLKPGTYYNSNIGLRFTIAFSDPAALNNFYLLRMFKLTYQKGYHPFKEILLFDSDDPVIEARIYNCNGFYNGTGMASTIFSDKVINGQKYNLNIIVRGEAIGNPIVTREDNSEYRTVLYFKLYSITSEFFQYLRILEPYNKNFGNPLSEPIIVSSNVKGGYGMLTGAGVSVDSIVFEY